MNDKLRIGVVGCGGISYAHLKGYKTLKEAGFDNFVISAACDVDKERAERFAQAVLEFQKNNIIVTTELDELIEQQAIDAADICSTVLTHHQLAIACLKAGIHATVEKPFAITIRAGEKMLKAAEESGAVLSVSENWHFVQGFRRAKWLIDKGYIGTPRTVMYGLSGREHCFPNKIVGNTPWRHDKFVAGGGAVFDIGAHDFRVLRALFGEVERVSGGTLILDRVKENYDENGNLVMRVPNSVDDVGFALIYFANGGIGLYAQGWGGHGEPGKIDGWMCLQGTKGSITSDTNDGVLCLDDKSRTSVKEIFSDKATAEEKEAYFPKGVTESFALGLHDFISAIQEGHTPENEGRQGLMDIAVSYAVIESSLLKQTVNVTDILSGTIDIYQRDIDLQYGLMP